MVKSALILVAFTASLISPAKAAPVNVQANVAVEANQWAWSHRAAVPIVQKRGHRNNKWGWLRHAVEVESAALQMRQWGWSQYPATAAGEKTELSTDIKVRQWGWLPQRAPEAEDKGVESQQA